MTSIIRGGPSDLVRWEVDIDMGYNSVEVYGARPQYVKVRPVAATLTLYDMAQTEVEAIVALVNEMRATGRSEPPIGPTPTGDRFSGLDIG